MKTYQTDVFVDDLRCLDWTQLVNVVTVDHVWRNINSMFLNVVPVNCVSTKSEPRTYKCCPKKLWKINLKKGSN